MGDTMSGLRSTSWPSRRLGEVAEINPETLGNDTPQSFRFRYVDLSSVDRGAIFWTGIYELTWHSAPSRARRVIRPEDVLFGTVRPQLQSHGFIPKGSPSPLVASTGFSVIRRKPDVTNARFLYHFVLSNFTTAQARRAEVGSNYPAVNESDVSGFSVPIPPLPEQRRIADILDALDEAIRRTEQVIAKLKQMKQGLVHDLLTRGIDENGELRDPVRHPEQFKDSPLGRIPREWEVAPFRNRALPQRQHIKTGPFGSSLKQEHWTSEGNPVITIGALGEGEFLRSELLHVSPQTARGLQQYAVQPGDIVFSRVADVGRSAVVSEAERGWLMSSNLMWISLDPREALPDYVQAALSASGALRAQIRRGVNAGGREIANALVLDSLLLPWPSPIEQESICDSLQGFDLRVKEEKSCLAKLRLLKAGLMDDLLTGRVRVKVPPEAA